MATGTFFEILIDNGSKIHSFQIWIMGMVKISNLQIKMPRDLIMKKHELDINLCQLCKRIIHFAATEMTLKVRSYEKISLKLVNQHNFNCETTEDPI